MISVRAPELLSLCHAAATRSGIDHRTLRARCLLHLPRLADRDARLPEVAGQAEVMRLAMESVERGSRFPIGSNEHTGHVSLRDLSFVELATPIARDICESLHYLGTYREGSLNFGLLLAGQSTPYAFCSISSMGFESKRSGLARILDAEEREISVLSRSYTALDAPRNSVSFLLAQVRRRLKKHGEYRFLVTAVDQNLAFQGRSYVASGWRLITTRRIDHYRYIDGRFVADAQLAERVGSLDRRQLMSRFGEAYQESCCKLLPRLIFGVSL